MKRAFSGLSPFSGITIWVGDSSPLAPIAASWTTLTSRNARSHQGVGEKTRPAPSPLATPMNGRVDQLAGRGMPIPELTPQPLNVRISGLVRLPPGSPRRFVVVAIVQPYARGRSRRRHLP